MEIKIGKEKVLIAYQKQDSRDYTQFIPQKLFGSVEDFEFIVDGDNINIQFKDKIVLSENISNITLNGTQVTGENFDVLLTSIIDNDTNANSSSKTALPTLNCSLFTGIKGSGNTNGAVYYQIHARYIDGEIQVLLKDRNSNIPYFGNDAQNAHPTGNDMGIVSYPGKSVILNFSQMVSCYTSGTSNGIINSFAEFNKLNNNDFFSTSENGACDVVDVWNGTKESKVGCIFDVIVPITALKETEEWIFLGEIGVGAYGDGSNGGINGLAWSKSFVKIIGMIPNN